MVAVCMRMVNGMRDIGENTNDRARECTIGATVENIAAVGWQTRSMEEERTCGRTGIDTKENMKTTKCMVRRTKQGMSWI